MQDLPNNFTSVKIENYTTPDMMYVVLVVILLASEGIPYQSPCAGTLLHKGLVITRASCIMTSPHDVPEADTIWIYDRNKNARRTDRIILLPDKHTLPGYGLALLLCEELDISEFPVLPTKEFYVNGSCKVAGFGSNVDRPHLRNFQVVTVEESEMTLCNSPKSKKMRICLQLTEVIPCVGDVGSPLVCDGVLHGIYTPTYDPFLTKHCVDRTDTMFTPVLPVVPWILKVEDAIPSLKIKWLSNPWYVLILTIAILLAIAGIYKLLVIIMESRNSILDSQRVSNPSFERQEDLVGNQVDKRAVTDD